MNTKILAICCMFVAGALAGGKYGDHGDDSGELITPGVPFPDPVTDRDDSRDDSRPRRKTTEATVIEGDPNKDYYDPNEPCPGCKGDKKRKVQLNFRIKLKSKNKNRNVNRIRISGFDGGVSASDNHSGPKVTTSAPNGTTAAGSTGTTAAGTTAAATTAATTVLPQAPAADGIAPPSFLSAIKKTSLNAPRTAGFIQGNAGSGKSVLSAVKSAASVAKPVAKPVVPAKSLFNPVIRQISKLKNTGSQLGAARAQAPQARAENKAAAGSKSAKKLVDLRGKPAVL